jgi:hypothetical protein
MNMQQAQNDQPLPLPIGESRFTGERVARTRPKTYRAIVRSLADPDAKVEHIAKLHRVSTHTVRAIRAREAVAIAERKQRLVSIFGNVAEVAAERMEELASGATLRDAGTTAGIATDKLLALLGEHAQGVPVQIDFQVNVQELHREFNAAMCALEAARASRADRDGEDKSESGSLDASAAGENAAQKEG